jgi:tetratricopeptide (TPR) repeat protein
MHVECQNSPHTLLLEGLVLLHEGNTDGGMVALEEAHGKLGLGNWISLYWTLTDLGTAFISYGLWEEAETVFRDLVDIFPGHPRGYFGLGKCCLQKEQETQALLNFRQALKAWEEATEDTAELVETHREVALLTRPSTS